MVLLQCFLKYLVQATVVPFWVHIQTVVVHIRNMYARNLKMIVYALFALNQTCCFALLGNAFHWLGTLLNNNKIEGNLISTVT